MDFQQELNRIYAPILPSLERVNQAIVDIVDSPFPLHLEPFFEGGKRLRPAAVLFSALAYSEQHDHAIRAAASVELVHASSLIHDDIVDQAVYRRNSEAINRAYGESIAVLAGDYVFVRALRGVYALEHPGILGQILQVVQDMIEGEFWEEYSTQQQDFTEDRYFKIISKKTASLFGGAFQIGGMVRQAPEEELRALYQAGYAYGMAFQILDDCMDLFDEDDGDAVRGRWSLPALYLERHGIHLSSFNGNLQELRHAVLDRGGFTFALETARRYEEDARRWVDTIPNEAVQDGLHRFLSTLSLLTRAVEVHAAS